MKQFHVNLKIVLGISVIVSIFFVGVWRINVHNQQRRAQEKKEAEHNIICYPEDLKDTKFMKEVMNNETIYLAETWKLKQLSREELAVLYHRYIENIQYLCKRKVRLGSIEDGGWDICDDTKLRPTSPCLVYSFGINNDFSFDDDAIKKYGCEVHSFDPSMGKESYIRNTLNHFHAIGISGRDQKTPQGWELLTYKSILQRLRHTEKKIAILKLDVERWEWDVLPNMLNSGSLDGIDNLAIEFHLELHGAEQGREVYFTAVSILKDLYDEGFRIFWTHQNKWCRFISRCRNELRTNCHEVNFVRVNRTQHKAVV